MKRIIYLICFLVVIFHAWNPGAPVLSSKEISNLLIPEIEKVIEVGTSDFYETFTSDDWGDLCRYENRQDRRYIFLDINNDAQKDLIVKMSFSPRCCASCYGKQTHLLVAIKKNGSYESKGMKSLGLDIGEGVRKKGRTLVFHNHTLRFSPSPIDLYHRPKRILISNLAKDSFYDSYHSVDNHEKENEK